MKVSISIIVVFFIIAIMIFGYQTRTSSPQSSSPAPALKLSHSYSLVMREEKGRKFDHGKSKKYWLRDTKDGVASLYFKESGGVFGKSWIATIEFDLQTLRGKWVDNLGGSVQGGAIHLNQIPHGFEFKIFNEFGSVAGSPPAYGQLIALP